LGLYNLLDLWHQLYLIRQLDLYNLLDLWHRLDQLCPIRQLDLYNLLDLLDLKHPLDLTDL